MRLQPLVRLNLESLGDQGAAWEAGLDELLEDLERQWSLRIVRRSLPGGSGSLVVRAHAVDGTERVLKIAMPGEDLTQQARVLEAADGRGYARFGAHDPRRRALMMESLGPSLAQSAGPVEESLDIMAGALLEAWEVDPGGTPVLAPVLAPGEDKASSLHRLVTAHAAQLEHDATPAVLTEALACAQRRAAAYDPDACVVVHGDPHPANLLRTRDQDAPTGRRWVFVDPDGLRAEAAYDVGVALRDWSSALRGPGARHVLEGWCVRMAAATRTDEQAVWEWAFLERVSTGLHVTSFGARSVGRPFLTSAAALLG